MRRILLALLMILLPGVAGAEGRLCWETEAGLRVTLDRVVPVPLEAAPASVEAVWSLAGTVTSAALPAEPVAALGTAVRHTDQAIRAALVTAVPGYTLAVTLFPPAHATGLLTVVRVHVGGLATPTVGVAVCPGVGGP